MSIIKEFSRRIEKFFTGNTTPTIPQIGTTHQDTNWKYSDIYQGELALNLTDGKLYTSDGKKLIHLNNNDNFINDGMELQKLPSSATSDFTMWVNVTSGSVSINNKIYLYENESPNNGNIELPPHGQTATNPRIDYIFAVLVNDVNGNKIVDFKVVSSYNQNDIDGTPTISVPDNSVFLGVVFVPHLYADDGSPNNGQPDYSLSTYSTAAMFPTYPVPNYEPLDFIQKLLRSTILYKPEQFYYKNQIVLDSRDNQSFNPGGSPLDINNYPTIIRLFASTFTGYATGLNPDSVSNVSLNNGTQFMLISGGTSGGTTVQPSFYIHVQQTAASQWEIVHNLERTWTSNTGSFPIYPNVSIIDDTGDEIKGHITYINENTLTIDFGEAVAGRAYIS